MMTMRPSSSSAWMSSLNWPTNTSVAVTVSVISGSSASTSMFSASHGVKSPLSDIQTSRGSATLLRRLRFLLSKAIAAPNGRSVRVQSVGPGTAGPRAREPWATKPARTTGRQARPAGKVQPEVMSRTTWTTDELRTELTRFEAELRAAGLRENTVRTYVDRSLTFVRWLAGEYRPTGTVQ